MRLRVRPPAGGRSAVRGRKYRITYTPGTYVPGPAGGPQTVVVPATAMATDLTGLEPFTLYTVDVAITRRGSAKPSARPATRLTAWTAAPATQRRFLYAVQLPSDRPGFTDLTPHIDVFDSALVETLGVSSLLYILIGYGAGRLRELRDPAHALTPVAVGALATAGAALGFSVIQFLLGVDAPVSWLLARDILVTILVNTILALPVYNVVRRVLLPLLPDDPRRRRRRAYTTGGLSPITRA